MKKSELLTTNKTYNDNIDTWNFLLSAYNGGKSFINSVLTKHERETSKNWASRAEEGLLYNYSAVVIDLYSFYLTEKSPHRDLGKLQKDTLWNMFIKDCDLYGTDFDVFINEAQKIAAACGSVGVLIDKASASAVTRASAIKQKIYPYCSLYTLPNILDWIHTRDPITNRPQLTYIKLRDYYDGRYILWWENKWEVWKLGDDDKPVMINSGENVLGEIPFVWLVNIRNPQDPYIGVSDIKDISLICASIARNISCGEEVIKYAGFPMMRKPMRQEGEEETQSDVVGQQAVLEFNPEQGEPGKPDWLEAPISEPITAILDWINKKISEVFRMAHLSGIYAHEKSDQVRSGVAIRYEFQQLTRVLAKKSENLTEAERRIISLWLKWQNQEDLFNPIVINRTKDFSVDDLSQSLENNLIAKNIVRSLKFYKELQKVIARKTLPDLPDTDMDEIAKEIDAQTELPEDKNKPDTQDGNQDGNQNGNRITPENTSEKVADKRNAEAMKVPKN